jgi:hypothetical protein
MRGQPVMFRKTLTLGFIGTMAVVTLAACNKSANQAAASNGTVSNTNVSQQQLDMQATTGQYEQKLVTAEPYPVAAMTDSAERANLKARLIRLNDPNKIGYVYGLSSTGQVMAFWTIKGKVSSMGSELSNTQNVLNNVGNLDGSIVDSAGDDGSFGPEECAATGIFFFTSPGDALVEWCGPWMYSDTPLQLSTAPIITVTANAAPTTPIPAGGSTKKG